MSENKDNKKVQCSADTIRSTDVNVGSTSSGLAAFLVQRGLENGKPISVPSLGITPVKGEKKSEKE